MAIDLQALKQDIWIDENADKLEEIDGTKGDYPRWVDTSTMIADPSTKTMKADRFINTMTSGFVDFVQQKKV